MDIQTDDHSITVMLTKAKYDSFQVVLFYPAEHFLFLTDLLTFPGTGSWSELRLVGVMSQKDYEFWQSGNNRALKV